MRFVRLNQTLWVISRGVLIWTTCLYLFGILWMGHYYSTAEVLSVLLVGLSALVLFAITAEKSILLTKAMGKTLAVISTLLYSFGTFQVWAVGASTEGKAMLLIESICFVYVSVTFLGSGDLKPSKQKEH